MQPCSFHTFWPSNVLIQIYGKILKRGMVDYIIMKSLLILSHQRELPSSVWSLSCWLEINIRKAESSNIEWVKFLRSSQNQILRISVFFLQWNPQDWCHWSVLWFFTPRSLEEVWSSIVHSLSCTNGFVPAIHIRRRWHGEWCELTPKNQVFFLWLKCHKLRDPASQCLGF